jgi:hypothetical protein
LAAVPAAGICWNRAGSVNTLRNGLRGGEMPAPAIERARKLRYRAPATVFSGRCAGEYCRALASAAGSAAFSGIAGAQKAAGPLAVLSHWPRSSGNTLF